MENLQRQDLTVIEEVEVLGRLVDNMPYTQKPKTEMEIVKGTVKNLNSYC